MHDNGYFDESVAQVYDIEHGNSDPALIAATAQVLCELAADGPALEFAIGTGRIALPLQYLGVPIQGIELSPAMVAEMRKKESSTPIPVAIGDMTTTRIAGDFALVFLVFNTIDNLTTQEAQCACFRNAAMHLQPGGRFVVETLIPPLQKIPYGETTHTFACTPDHWGIDVFDSATQQYTSNHIRTKNGTVETLIIPFRYTWPSELDLMAKLAGLELEHRWADWHKSPFTHLSRAHISIWRKPLNPAETPPSRT